MYNGVEANLLPYFNGALLSSNRGGSKGVSVNFLDDGGAAPLMMNKPSNTTNSNQYLLLTHLYEYFGMLLQCSKQGSSAYPAYSGFGSMYEVHKFMNLEPNEVGYFITQVADAALSFGVAAEDLEPVGKAPNMLFGYRCAPPMTVIAQLQSICSSEECPVAPNSTCAGVVNGTEPMNATSTGTASATATATMSGSGSASSPTSTTVVVGSGARVVGMSLVAAFA
ncbi:hypothetical protein DL95DRAFT_476289, partial [Leptodontidium sp. 2 PMI_412]